MDYRFFPEPDLPPLVIADAHVDAIKAALPELPEATMSRLSREYGFSRHLSRLIVCAPGGASGGYFSLARACHAGDLYERWTTVGYLTRPVHRTSTRNVETSVAKGRRSILVRRLEWKTQKRKVRKL